MKISPQASQIVITRQSIAIEKLLPDDQNRPIDEDDEFRSLVDSIKVLGILQPLHVQELDDGFVRLIDGERRWRAAQEAGLVTVPCEVWPKNAEPARALVVGLVLNEHRKAHGCIAVARRLREIKNELGITQEELAARTGLPLDRVKTYGSLFQGSDDLIEFLEKQDVPVKVALELVRYEKATNEARTRKLLERHLESPLTRHQIAALRKRALTGKHAEETKCPGNTRQMFSGRLERAFARDPNRARAELEDVLERLGLRLAPASGLSCNGSGPGKL